MQLMKLLGRHLENGVDARGVVNVEETVDLVDEFSEGIESIGITEIHLELGVEGFLISVLPRASCMTHGLPDTQEIAEHLHIRRGIFASTVRVHDLRGWMLVNAGEE